jgi:hypothetical protein
MKILPKARAFSTKIVESPRVREAQSRVARGSELLDVVIVGEE